MSTPKEEETEAVPSPPPYSEVADNVDASTSKEPVETKVKTISFFQMFRYADKLDCVMMTIGILLALGEGSAFPASLLLFAKILNALITYSDCWQDMRDQMIAAMMANQTAMMKNHSSGAIPNSTHLMANLSAIPQLAQLFPEGAQLGAYDAVSGYCRDYAMIGLGMVAANCIHTILWSFAGQRQLERVRNKLFRAMLSKDAGWFDARRSGALNTVLFEQVRKMECGMTANVSLTAHFLGVAISGYVVAFQSDWKVSIVIFSLVPLFFAIGFVMITLVRIYTAKQLQAYGQAGSVANEVLGNARTVLAFNRQEYEVERYGSSLITSMRMGMIKTVASGSCLGCVFIVLNSMGGLAFWWGSNPEVAQAGGSIMQIIACMMIGSMGLCNAMPNFSVMATAVGAADQVFAIIDEESKIDNFSSEGRRLEKITGNISFEDVAFAYPSREDRLILKSFTLHVKHGQTVALVGPSGCGKSTTVQMLLRFYDAVAGKVTIDGVNIQEFDVRWLRHNIGLVSQEPVLFNMSIKENIRMGALDRAEVPDEDIVAACKLANAHSFISALPEGYNTMVGERGAQLSGGQKQRIAIARALISNPKILVLDEATSALDTNSEKIVQSALDNARVGRTTLVIAHRLSTIRNADTIAVIDGGVIAELGDHESLMETGGLYYRLVKTQEVQAMKDSQAVEEVVDDDEIVSAPAEVSEFDETKEQDNPESRRRRLTRLSSMMSSRTKSIHEAEDGVQTKKRELSRLESMGVVMKWNRPELFHIIFCCIIAFVSGGVDPGFGVVVSEFLTSFCPGDTNKDRFNMLIGIVVGLGACQAILMTIEYYLFAQIGEQLTKRVRCLLLGKFLRMDSAWLDKQENQPSVLTTILATDCTDIQGISGIRISLYLTDLATLAGGIIYSLVLDYRIALPILGLAPLMAYSSLVIHRVILHGGQTKDSTSRATAIIAMDALNNMRTVMSLGAEPLFLQRFSAQYGEAKRSALKTSILNAPLIASTLPSILWAGAITFGLGSYLMQEGETEFMNVIRIYVLLTLCIPAVGRQPIAIADEGRASKSTNKILDILNYETKIDKEDPATGGSLGAKEIAERKELLARPCTGRIEFKHVAFSYPNRPGIKVLRDVNFTVEPGQRVALCGPSGGGKSTIMQLVQRLYDTDGGSVLIDGEDIRKANVRLIRSNIGLVAQEPVLFALTINENIAYGSRTADEKPTKDQIDNVCRQANVHGFLQKLPEGFDTFVGERGAQLSGGQKQRIAIARALVRNPAILLLDEATSALDTESERIVQDAIDLAAHGRTSLTIAHRLSTIQNSDKILVLDQGRVAEQGTHAELMAMQGIYYNLQLAQTKQPVHPKKF